MAAPVRFLSGRQQQQKIGIEGSTQNEKVLEVVGRVGIGTTVFDTTKALDVRGDVEISGIISATRFLGDGSQLANLPASGVGATDNVNTSGIITASTFSGNGDFTNLSVSGLSTFSSLVDINANLDVTGHTELDNVNVSGVSTFASAIDANGGLDVSGGSGLVANTAKISDLTDNRVVIAGASGELEDSSKLTFDGTKLAVDGNLGVTGLTTTQNLNVAGVSTFVGLVTVTNGDVHIAQRLFVGGLEVEGTGSENTFTGINTFTNQQDNTLGNTNTGSLQGNGGLGIDKNASFGDKVFVQNAIGINSTAPIGKLDVNGHTELDDVNVSAALTAASLNVTNKLTTTGLGISVANGTGNTAYIEGPSEIWIDPAPAGAGTTSGLVRIRGDLYVDGTEFIVDVDKVQLSDYRIGIATTAGTNAVLDGAGLGIGSESIEKTITWNNATSALMSSENWNLASGKHYEIAGTDVLTSTTLGGGVVNSSLTSVGTLGSLTVSGDITANGNIVGDNATNISNINQVTATTFSGALSGNATSATTATNVTVADESSDTTCNVLFTTGATGNLAPKSGTNLTFNSSNGTLTATEFSGGGAGLTGLTASQVGAIADIVSDTTPQLGGNLDVNNKDITGTGNVNLTGIVTATNFVGGGAGLTGITAGQVGAITDLVSDTTPQLGGNLDLNSKLINGTGGINVTGIVTASSFDGNITGIATYTSEWIITSNGSSDYKFTGPGFDGTELDPTIYLVRGQEYKFTNNMGAHPFQIRTAINGSAYNDGISNNGVSNGTLTWDVQMDAPNVLYYQCTAHAGMVGKIYIGNSGDSVNVGTGVTINAGGINVTGVVTATSFVGNGAGLTGLTANQVGAIGDVVSDTTPQLGGNLDLNSKTINGTGTINFTGNVTATAFAGSGANLTSLPVPTEVIVTDESSDTSCNVLFTTAATGNQAPKSGTNLTFNSSSGTLTATAFSGDGSALTNLPAGTTIPVADESSDTECFLVFTTAATGDQAPKTGTNLTFNSASGILTATTFSGSGASLTNVDAATLDGIDSGSFLRSDATDVKTSGNLTFNDNVYARFGNSGDLIIFHSGTDSFIANTTTGGSIFVQAYNDEDVAIRADNGSGGFGLADYVRAVGTTGEVILSHYGTEKLATKAGGVTVTGILTATTFSGSGASLTAVDAATLDGVDSTSFLRSDAADSKTSGDLTFSDGVKARFGTNGELNVYHESNASIILNSTIGDIIIRNEVDDADTVIQGDDGSGGNTPYFRADGSTGEAMLYHYGSLKLATKSTGVDVTGDLTLTDTDAGSAAGPELKLFRNSASPADADYLGQIKFAGESDTGVERNYAKITGKISDASNTSEDGILEFAHIKAGSQTITGRWTSTELKLLNGTHLALEGDSQELRLGASDDLQLWHNGSHSFISNITGNLNIRTTSSGGDINLTSNDNVTIKVQGGSETAATFTQNGSVDLYYDNSKKFETTSGGATVTGTLTATAFSGDGSALTNLPTTTPDKISEGNTEVEVIDTGSNGHVKFTTEGSERARIDASGRLGIGTTNPGSTLEINVGTATSALDIQGSAGQLFSVTNNLTSGSIFSVNDVSGIPSIDVDADGTIQLAPFSSTEMVGIGTTNPTSKLHVVGDARVTGVITATSFSGSGANLTGISFDLVDDTTPQLGGDLNTNSNRIAVPDSSGSGVNRVTFGDSQDLQIYHNGTHSYIKEEGTGELRLGSNNAVKITKHDSETLATFTVDGAVDLYYDNSKKFETTSGGATVTGTLTATAFSGDGSALTGISFDLVDDTTPQLGGDLNTNSNLIQFPDSGSSSANRLTFGDHSDLSIYHDGSNSYIEDTGTGNLILKTSRTELLATDGTEMAFFIPGDAVDLFFNNAKKFSTKADGAKVYGELECTTLDVDGAADITGDVTLHANLDLQDNDKILIGTGDDLEIYHDGTNSYIHENTGNLKIESDSSNSNDIQILNNNTTSISNHSFSYSAKFISGGSVELYEAGSKKLETTDGGVTVTGIVTATSFEGDGSALTGISAGGSPEFYTGITSSTQITPLSFETSVFTFPSTSGRQYVIESINVANVDESVGVGTTVNIIASIQDATAAEQTYIAYNVPIVTGGLIELLKNPIVAGPSDVIKMWTTNDDYVGVNNAADVYINYTEFESTDYISKFASSTTINSTDTITLYTSTGNPTMIEKIGFANRTDTGDFPVSIKITNGVTTSYLAKNLIIPRYSTVDILDRHKRIETGAKIEVEVGSTNTVDVIISGKKITS